MNIDKLKGVIAELKEKYHVKDLSVKGQSCFGVSNGMCTRVDITARVIADYGDPIDIEVDDDNFDLFLEMLRDKVARRCRYIFDDAMYEHIANDILDWDGQKSNFSYEEGGLKLEIERSFESGDWEIIRVVNEDGTDITEDYDADWDGVRFDVILQRTREKREEDDENRRHTEEMLNRYLNNRVA